MRLKNEKMGDDFRKGKFVDCLDKDKGNPKISWYGVGSILAGIYENRLYCMNQA